MIDPELENASSGKGVKVVLIVLVVLSGAAFAIHYFNLLPSVTGFFRKAKPAEAEVTPAVIEDPMTGAKQTVTIAQEEVEAAAEKSAEDMMKEEEARAAKYRAAFKPPKIGSKITLVMKNGSKMTGVLECLDENGVRIKTGNAAITLNKAQMSDKALALCYEDEYVNYMLAQDAQDEIIERRRAKAAEAWTEAASATTTGKTASASATSKTSGKKAVKDASIKTYMEKHGGGSEALKERQERVKEYEASK